jgi:hypothetical protein
MLLCHSRGKGGERGLAALLAPDVSPTLAGLVLGRSAYTSAEERDAETLASLILGQASDSLPRLPAQGTGTTPVLCRMEHSWSIKGYSEWAQPFTWTKTADRVLDHAMPGCDCTS